MQVNRIYFAIFISFLAAFSVEEAQEVQPQKESKDTNVGIPNENNTDVSNQGPKSNSSPANTTKVNESSTKKPPIDRDVNPTNAVFNQSVIEEPKTINVPEQNNKSNVLDSISVKIFRAEDNGIWLSDMRLNTQTPYKNISLIKAFSVDYHYQKRMIFSAANNTINRDEIFGRKMTIGNSSVIVSQEVDGPMSLGVDWVHDKLYWYSNRHSYVECSELDGSNRTPLIDSLENTEYPSNIAIDPYEGFIFIVSNYSIYRARLDGSDLIHMQLKGNETRAVRSIAVDTHNKRLYYTGKDGHHKTGKPYVASCNYRGENVQEVLLGKEGWNDIFSIGVFRNTLYFAHYPKSGPDTLWRFDLTKSSQIPVQVYTTEGGLWSIKIYHPKVQKKGEVD